MFTYAAGQCICNLPAVHLSLVDMQLAVPVLISGTENCSAWRLETYGIGNVCCGCTRVHSTRANQLFIRRRSQTVPGSPYYHLQSTCTSGNTHCTLLCLSRRPPKKRSPYPSRPFQPVSLWLLICIVSTVAINQVTLCSTTTSTTYYDR